LKIFWGKIRGPGSSGGKTKKIKDTKGGDWGSDYHKTPLEATKGFKEEDKGCGPTFGSKRKRGQTAGFESTHFWSIKSKGGNKTPQSNLRKGGS